MKTKEKSNSKYIEKSQNIFLWKTTILNFNYTAIALINDDGKFLISGKDRPLPHGLQPKHHDFVMQLWSYILSLTFCTFLNQENRNLWYSNFYKRYRRLCSSTEFQDGSQIYSYCQTCNSNCNTGKYKSQWYSHSRRCQTRNMNGVLLCTRLNPDTSLL